MMKEVKQSNEVKKPLSQHNCCNCSTLSTTEVFKMKNVNLIYSKMLTNVPDTRTLNSNVL